MRKKTVNANAFDGMSNCLVSSRRLNQFGNIRNPQVEELDDSISQDFEDDCESHPESSELATLRGNEDNKYDSDEGPRSHPLPRIQPVQNLNGGVIVVAAPSEHSIAQNDSGRVQLTPHLSERRQEDPV